MGVETLEDDGGSMNAFGLVAVEDLVEEAVGVAEDTDGAVKDQLQV